MTATSVKLVYYLLYIYQHLIFTYGEYPSYCERQNVPRECDFIVVGAGGAGATLASRLSEDPDVTMCLIEAGVNDRGNPVSSIIEQPRLWPLLLSEQVTWNYKTVPQNGLNGREIFNGMGKTLGGSTSHNALNYGRGLKADFDFWEASGAVGWSYNDVLPFFKKLENQSPPSTLYNNHCGPFTVSKRSGVDQTPLFQLLLQAAKESGIPKIDCDEANLNGICQHRKSIRSGRRESTSTAYLQPVCGRRNLYIITEALVTKILITGSKKRAYGVRYVKNGQSGHMTIRASREVIISAGTIGSAQLLQLSGIGPKNLLQSLGIKLRVDLPVGENYHDHVILIFTDILMDIPTVTADLLKDAEVLDEYLTRRTGILSDNYAVLAWNFFTSNRQTGAPDVLVYFADLVFPRPDDNNRRNGSTAVLFLLQPQSRGSVFIRSKDPKVPPLIDPNYFQQESDIETIIQGIRKLQDFVNTPSMKAVNAAFRVYKIPESCSNEDPDSDQQWRCILRSMADTAFHPVSTCKMGNALDKTTVVDPSLRVKGIERLRVADASIMPRVVSAATMSTSIMIGEKAADIIKRDYMRK